MFFRRFAIEWCTQKKQKKILSFQSPSFINIIELNEWSKNDSENDTWISIFTEKQTKNRCSNRIIFNINLVEILSRSQKYLNEDLQDIFPVKSEMHLIRFFLLIIKKSGMIFLTILKDLEKILIVNLSKISKNI